MAPDFKQEVIEDRREPDGSFTRHYNYYKRDATSDWTFYASEWAFSRTLVQEQIANAASQ